MTKNKKEFNLIIAGIGGQGLITLLQILAEAALSGGNDVRSSELHGLAQRGGSVEIYLRFGKEIFSPLVAPGRADFILGLEMQEALRMYYYANPDTVFLVNKNLIPIPLAPVVSQDQIIKDLNKISKKIEVVPAADICQKELGTNVVAGIYLISLAVFQKMIPLKPESLLLAIKKMIPEKFLELNLKAFNLAKSNS